MELNLLEVAFLIFVLHSKVIVCSLDGYSPKLKALFQWIFFMWTPNGDIYLFSQGFFVVRFFFFFFLQTW